MSKNLLLFLQRLGVGLKTPNTLPQETGTQKTGLAFLYFFCSFIYNLSLSLSQAKYKLFLFWMAAPLPILLQSPFYCHLHSLAEIILLKYSLVYCNVRHNHTIYLNCNEKVLHLNLLNCAVKLIMRKHIRKRIIKQDLEKHPKNNIYL